MKHCVTVFFALMMSTGCKESGSKNISFIRSPSSNFQANLFTSWIDEEINIGIRFYDSSGNLIQIADDVARVSSTQTWEGKWSGRDDVFIVKLPSTEVKFRFLAGRFQKFE